MVDAVLDKMLDEMLDDMTDETGDEKSSAGTGQLLEWQPPRVSSRRRPRETAYRRPASGMTRSNPAVGGPVPCPQSAPDAGYRMGRWARLAVTVTVVITAVFVGTAVFGSDAGAPAAVTQVTVKAGDTLWGIAAAYAPDADPRAVVDRIRELNGLDESPLPVGVVLEVPVG